MTVEVLYFAEFKEITGIDRESFILDNKNLQELVIALINKYSHIKNLIWDENNQTLKNRISIAINNTILHNKEKLSKELSDGDKVAFLLPVSGG